MSKMLPPQNLDAERSVLGAILLKHENLETALETINEKSFYDPRHELIFVACRDLRKLSQPIDFITLSDHLRKKDQFERIGSATYLVELSEHGIGAYNIKGYCSIIREKALSRSIISMAQEIQSRAFNQDFDEISSLVEFAQKSVLQLDTSSDKNSLHEIHDVMKLSIGEIETRYKSQSSILGISSGFKNLDELTNGFKPGEMIVLAARPSMGKTACSLSLAANISLGSKKRIAYFSIEMPKETLVMRMLASRAAIPLDRIMTGRIYDNEWARLITAAGEIAESRMVIDESNPLSPQELRSRCRRLKMSGDLDCVMVDYLQMMRVKDEKVETREREVAEISATLKSIAKELQIPVIALAQLNRGSDRREDKRPTISDLRESGSIEMDADVIMLLYRDDYYERNDPSNQGQAEIIIAKNRNGKTGTAKMRFESDLNRFSDAN